MEYLYHYTKLDTCIKIILSGTILFNKLKDISDLIDNNNIDLAYSNIKELIEQFKELYERNS